MLIKTIIRQGKSIFDLSKENKTLYAENQEIRWDIAELENYKKDTEKLHDRIIMCLLDLQDVNRLGVSEQKKNEHRNIIINGIIKELSDLDNPKKNNSNEHFKI